VSATFLVDTILMADASGGRGRRRGNYSLAFKRELAAATLQPGVSVARLGREHGINANMLFKWRNQYRSGAFDEPQAKILPVVVDGGSEGKMPGKLELPAPSGPKKTASGRAFGSIEIHLNGASVRISGIGDEPTLRTVLASLR
jgi:transposase